HRSNRIALRNLFIAFDEALEVVDCLRLSAEGHLDVAVRVELNDHSGTFVNHPDIVVLIDADGVREGSGVVIRSPQLYKLQVLVELEQLGGRATTRTAAGASARIHKQVALGILGNSFGFTEGVAGSGEREMFLGDVQLRSGLLKGKFLLPFRLRLGAIAELRSHLQRPRANHGAEYE